MSMIRPLKSSQARKISSSPSNPARRISSHSRGVSNFAASETAAAGGADSGAASKNFVHESTMARHCSQESAPIRQRSFRSATGEPSARSRPEKSKPSTIPPADSICSLHRSNARRPAVSSCTKTRTRLPAKAGNASAGMRRPAPAMQTGVRCSARTCSIAK